MKLFSFYGSALNSYNHSITQPLFYQEFIVVHVPEHFKVFTEPVV